ncbi:MAG: hypothetical protein KDC24_02515 [Saprospiraceae bacterium]|nr:hypothetical protein [Saprospiraceae bacterium]
MKNLIRYSFALLAMASFSIGAIAQEDLPSGEVDVIKNFDARLLDAEILRVDPQLPPADTTTKRQTYSIPARTIQVEYLPPAIRPLAMKRQSMEEIYNGFAKLGAGLPNSIFGEAGYGMFSNEKYDWNVYLKHHSANNNKNIENQRFSENEGKIEGTYYFDEGFAVNGRIGYSRDLNYFYGYTQDDRFQDTSFTKDDVQQRFSKFNIGASIFNGVQTVGDVNYSASADFYRLQDNYASRENGFDLNIHLTKWFNEKHPLAVTIRTDFNQLRDTIKKSLNNFFIQPNFTYHSDYFRVKVGVNIATSNDKYSFFPQVEATVPILGSRLAAFVGADGTLSKNTMATLTAINPFLNTRFSPINTKYWDYYGGLKGSISGVEYQAKLGYKQTQDLVLFVPNYDYIAQRIVPYNFNVITDNANIFYIGGSLEATIIDGLSILGAVNSSVYDLETEEDPWGLPSLTINGTIKYLALEGKATVKASLYVENGIPFPTEAGISENQNGLFDISVGGEYRFSEHFGAFIDIYNLSGVKRRRWYNYPTFGINALVGVTARF